MGAGYCLIGMKWIGDYQIGSNEIMRCTGWVFLISYFLAEISEGNGFGVAFAFG